MKNSEKADIAPITIRSYEHLGSSIRRVRKLLKISQEELAKKAGITQTTISNLERGKSSAEIGTLMLILAALNLDLRIAPRPKEDSQKSLEGLY